MTLLAVDNSIAVQDRENPIWEKNGIAVVRAVSMSEAIEKLIKKDVSLITINADTIKYLPQLLVMRDLTIAPIFIITSNHSAEDGIQAYHHGADSYNAWSEQPGDNAAAALAFMNHYYKRTPLRKPAKKPRLLSYKGILVTRDYRKLFVNDIEVPVTKIEFEIIWLLMKNRGRILTYPIIFRHIWGDGYDETAPDILWSHIKRLRKKLADIAPDIEYIENERGVGYKFPSNPV